MPSTPGAPFRQLRPGPAPIVQSAGPLPGLGPSVRASGRSCSPTTLTSVDEPNGSRSGGSPPAYRQPSERLPSVAPPPSLTKPANGGSGAGLDSIAPPHWSDPCCRVTGTCAIGG